MANKRSFSEEEEKKICKEYEEGKSAKKLAEKYNVHQMTMGRILRRNGFKTGRNKLTDQNKIEICKEYKEGLTLDELGKKYDVHPVTIKRLLKAHSVYINPKTNSSRKFTDEEEKEICKEYQEGKTAKKLSNEYNVHEMTVGKILKRNGIKARRRKFTDEEEKEICKEYQKGKTARELGKKYSISETTVRRLLKKHGVKLRLSINSNIKRRKVSDEYEKMICEEYINGLSTTKLSNKYNFHPSTIILVLKRNNVPIRKLGRGGGFNDDESKLICNEYKNGLTFDELGKKYKKTPMAIYKLLKKYNINPRARGEHKRVFSPKDEEDICKKYLEGFSSNKLAEKYNVNYNSILGVLERHNIETRSFELTDEEKEEICNLYQEGLGSTSIALKYNCAVTTIISVINDFGIKIRSHKGESHYNWKGGISFEPYCPKFNDEFRERVRIFWQRKCGICGLTEEDNTHRLHVHHVNYKKMACCDNIPPLFIALCNSCHTRTNHNREYWENNLTSYIQIWYDGDSYMPLLMEKEQTSLDEIIESADLNSD